MHSSLVELVQAHVAEGLLGIQGSHRDAWRKYGWSRGGCDFVQKLS